jgi:hypothetical protein
MLWKVLMFLSASHLKSVDPKLKNNYIFDNFNISFSYILRWPYLMIRFDLHMTEVVKFLLCVRQNHCHICTKVHKVVMVHRDDNDILSLSSHFGHCHHIFIIVITLFSTEICDDNDKICFRSTKFVMTMMIYLDVSMVSWYNIGILPLFSQHVLWSHIRTNKIDHQSVTLFILDVDRSNILMIFIVKSLITGATIFSP